MHDEKLIRRLKSNDQQAYSDLFDRYFGGLFSFAYNMVFREDVAYDIVQEIFVAVYEKSSGLRDDSSLKSFLYTSVKNRCYNYLRDRKVEDRWLILYAEACMAANALDVIEDDELLRRVNEFMETLPDQCREVCMMRLAEGRSFGEIAARLDISESTVRVQLHRGIKKMHGYFSAHHVAIAFLLGCMVA